MPEFSDTPAVDEVTSATEANSDTPSNVPYARFAEMVGKKNAAIEEATAKAARLEGELAALKGAVTGTKDPQTVADLNLEQLRTLLKQPDGEDPKVREWKVEAQEEFFRRIVAEERDAILKRQEEEKTQAQKLADIEQKVVALFGPEANDPRSELAQKAAEVYQGLIRQNGEGAVKADPSNILFAFQTAFLTKLTGEKSPREWHQNYQRESEMAAQRKAIGGAGAPVPTGSPSLTDFVKKGDTPSAIKAISRQMVGAPGG